MTLLYVLGAIEYVSVSLIVARMVWSIEKGQAPVGLCVFVGLLWPVWIPIHVVFMTINGFVSDRPESGDKK